MAYVLRFGACAVVCGLLAACGDDDAGIVPRVDAGGSTRDAGGSRVDAGSDRDAGPSDAGTAQDASVDAGPSLDAATDGAVAADSGPSDAAVDAGPPADAGPPVMVSLQMATASASQSGYSVAEAIDGTIPAGPTVANGWAGDVGSATDPQTAVFETTADTPSYVSGTRITFTITHSSVNAHQLGRFRLSATTASRDDFADGLAASGDLGAAGIWTALTPATADATDGVTLTIQGDDSILASGSPPLSSTYTIVADTTLVGITGIRLETLEDASLPDSGPGLASNGNYVVSELELLVQAAP